MGCTPSSLRKRTPEELARAQQEKEANEARRQERIEFAKARAEKRERDREMANMYAWIRLLRLWGKQADGYAGRARTTTEGGTF